MTTNDENARRIAKAYLLAGEIDLPALKASMAKNADKPWPAELKVFLRRFVDEDGHSENDYAALTQHEFDEPEEYRQWIEGLWSYLYEDGEEPE